MCTRPFPPFGGGVWARDYWGHCLVLQAQQSCDYLHRFVLEHVQSRDGAHDQEKASNVPRPFPRVRDGVWERDYFSIGMLCVQSADDLYQKIAKSHHVYDHYQVVSTTENCIQSRLLI